MANYQVQIALEGRDNASDDFKRVNRELENLDDGVQKSTESMGGLEKGAELVAKAMAAMYLLDAAGEVNKLGAEANAAERTFIQLSGGVDQANKNLELMRASTRGTVDDMVLQRESNRLLLMELAATGEEASKLTGIAVSLGKAMGTDAATAAADFAALLANQSIPRLDTFGISSAKVRQRIEELKASGMGMEEAFNAAVIEQGELAISRLGNTLDAAATSTEKLTTRFENLKQNLGQGVNSTVEAAATTLEQIIQIAEIRGGNSPAQVAAREQADAMAKAFSDEYIYAISQYMGKETFDNAADATAWVAAIDSAFAAVIADPTLMQDKQRLMDALVGVDDGMKDQFADAIMLSLHDKSVTIAIDQINAQRKAEQEAAAKDQANAYVQGFVGTIKQKAGLLTDLAGSLNIFEPPSDMELWRQRQADIAAATDELNTFTNSYADMWPVLDVNNATDVGTLDMLLANATEELANLQALAEQGLIPDADMEKAQGIVDNLTTMQDKITNIQGMTLDGLLGKGQGDGSLGQLAGQVMTGIDKTGMSPEQVAALQQQFDLMTGNATASSIALDEQVVPIIQQIAQDLGPEAAAQALQNVNDYLEQGNYLLLTPEQIAAGLPMATGFTQTSASGASFEVKPGESAGAAAARMGMTVEELLATTGAKDARSIRAGSYDMGPSYAAVGGFDPSQLASSMIDDTTVQAVADVQADIEQMGQDMPGITTEFTAVNTEVTTIQSVIAEMASKVHKISVELDIKGLDVLNAALGMFGGGSAGTGTSVQNNGGRVPGMDERTAA